MTAGPVVARRTFTIGHGGGRTLEAAVYAPVQDGEDFRSDYVIWENGRRVKSFYGMGVDSMQALISALQRLGSDIDTSDHALKRDLYWNGQNERLGLLLPPEV